MYAILSLAGCAIMFFGYDASVMSLVNTNQDYLHLMGAASGSKRDSAAIGGLVSLWFGGFAIGKLLFDSYYAPKRCASDTYRRYFRGTLCRPYRALENYPAWLSMGTSWSCVTIISSELHVDGVRENYRWSGMWSSQYCCANLDIRARRSTPQRGFRGR